MIDLIDKQPIDINPKDLEKAKKEEIKAAKQKAKENNKIIKQKNEKEDYNLLEDK